MAAEQGGTDLVHVVALLGAAVVAVPIFRRLGLGSVLGYLAAGLAIGPFGLALFTERNPQPEVAVFTLGPLAGRAQVATRLRLATSQAVVAVAQMADGSCWQQRVTVVVTLAACVEGE